MAAVDSGAWDGGAAYKSCSSASDYASVCAGRRAGDPSKRSTWALPHHSHPGAPPNADGVRAALSRFPQTQGLTNAKAAKAHLEAHMSVISPGRSTRAPGARPSDGDAIQCPWCHAMNATDAIYCDQCGRSLAMVPPDESYALDPNDTVRCPSCGKMNDDDAQFCDQCGASLDILAAASASPSSDLFRAVYPGAAVRDLADGQPVMFGHFSRFNEWTEIDSTLEGRFMERVAPGTFVDSFASITPKVMFQHGRDPEMGEKVLGLPTVREDDVGAAYEVPMFPSVPPLLLDGLRAGAYGSSFRFSVQAEDVVRKPKPSDYNPEGLTERTITRARVAEFGPVTFPAYAGATAGIRSITDEFRVPNFTDQLSALVREEPATLARLIEKSLPKKSEAKPPEDKASPRFRSREEYLAWIQQS